MTIKNIINKFISFWNNFFSKIELSRNQRVDATAYLFMALEKICKENKINQEEYDITLQGDIDKDADGIYVMLRKNNLIDDILISQLQSLKALAYFENLKLEDFTK
ncbi:hypothetical protein N5915_04115 [Arcobacter lacus]|uniref:hypothetical protein n=1 Tax=Arcobacter lacus TaxID=1912876 RepID=UPI0021BADCB9|nr:hypothetical protein [Arcobacter lacus]MCT7908736.1 hypothetical protein [Arcobacter lacus]